MVEDVEYLLLVKFHQNQLSGCNRKVEKSLNQSETRAANLLQESGQNTNVVVDVEYLPPVKFRQIRFSLFEKS